MARGVATGLQHQAEHPLESVVATAKAPARIAKIFLTLAAIYSPPADPSLAAQHLQRAQQATQMINAKIAEKIDQLRRMSWQEYTQHSAQILTETFVDIIKFRTLGLAANQIAKIEKYLTKIAKLIEAERPVAAAVGSTPTMTTLLEEAAPAIKQALEESAARTSEAAKTAERSAVAAAEGVDSCLSKTDIKHFSKHIPNEFAQQAKRMPREALSAILEDRTFFNPAWSEQDILQAVEEGYRILRSQGLTKVQPYNFRGEIIEIFIKPNGALGSAWGLHKLPVDYFIK
jgi:hypothetical protein